MWHKITTFNQNKKIKNPKILGDRVILRVTIKETPTYHNGISAEAEPERSAATAVVSVKPLIRPRL
jgi:hypothetical protein